MWSCWPSPFRLRHSLAKRRWRGGRAQRDKSVSQGGGLSSGLKSNHLKTRPSPMSCYTWKLGGWVAYIPVFTAVKAVCRTVARALSREDAIHISGVYPEMLKWETPTLIHKPWHDEVKLEYWGRDTAELTTASVWTRVVSTKDLWFFLETFSHNTVHGKWFGLRLYLEEL